VIDSTFSGNRATGGDATGLAGTAGDGLGGGLAATGAALSNSTLALNAAAAGTPVGGRALGGGAYVQMGGALGVRSSILAGNTAGAGPDYGGPGAANSLGANLVGVGGPAFLDGTDGDQAGTAAAPLDARLGTLADNGGPTPTHLPLPNS